ncbi:TonB-dependent receptor [Shewanella sp. H8]|uniref:TonB-dependent receptor plug domain-containing protein n=1 Tax=Shewanella sp. H8 TaxID=3342676 RepID=UPI003315D0F1
MISRKTTFKLSTVTLAIGLCFTVQADEISRDPLLNINEVIVVHGDGGQPRDMATTHWSINDEEIRATGAQTLEQVLKNVPGVYIRVGGDGTPRVDIRGFKSRHVTLLVNGVPMSSAGDGQFNPSVIPTSQIASIEVSVGPTSVLYGPSGAGGVINIITKQGNAAPALSGRLESGENDTFNGDISAAGSGDDWQGLMSVSRQQTDAYPMSDDFEATEYQDDNLRENSDKEVTNVYAQGSYWLSDKTQLITNMAFRNGDWGKPSRDGTGTGSVKFERVDDFDEHTLQLGLAHEFNDTFIIRGFGYHNQTDMLEASYKDETYLDLKETQDSSSVVQGINLQLITDLKNVGLLTTSVIAEKQSWESTIAIDDPDNIDDSAWLYTAAAEYQYHSERQYGFTLGASFHSLDNSDSTDDNYSAMASSYWQVAKDSRLSLSVARKVRFPSMENLYSLSAGNSDLEAEESKHVELGLEQNLPADTDFSLYGYYTDAKNYIAKDNDDFYQNMDRYKFKGIDFQINNNSIDKLDLSFSYSFLDSEEMADDDTLDSLQYRPRHQLRWQVNYELPFELKMNLNVERILDQVYAAKVKIDGKTQYQQQSLDNYTLVDINLAYPLINEKLELYIRSTNLFDENYYQSESLPQAGRQVFVGVNWQI